MDATERKRLAALADAATGVRWAYNGNEDGQVAAFNEAGLWRAVARVVDYMGDRDSIKHDAAFIAAARQAVPNLLAALAEAEAEVERLRADLALALRGIDTYVGANAATTVERDRYRRQVEAVRAMCSASGGAFLADSGAGPFLAVPVAQIGRAMGGDVPMSPNMGHDLRERIAHDIDQAHAQAKYLLLDDGYREGYLDGLDAAERIARGES